MIKKIVVVGMVFMLAACGSGGGGSGSGSGTNTQTNSNTSGSNNSTSYFPLTVGSKWTYLVHLDPTTTRVDTCEIQPDGRMKTVETGSNSFLSTITTDNAGIYTTNQEYSHTASTNTETYIFSPPMLMFPSNLNSGAVTDKNFALAITSISNGVSNTTTDSGSIKFTVLGTETVTITAGTFTAVKLQYERSRAVGASVKDYQWYAAGVGLVKTADDTGFMKMELTSYSIK